VHRLLANGKAVTFFVLCLAVLSLGPAPGWAAQAEQVTLELMPSTAAYGSAVTLSGTVSPASAERVDVFRFAGGEWRFVVGGDSAADGSYSFSAVARTPSDFIARTDEAQSPRATLRIKPRLRAVFDGVAVLGAPLYVAGRLRPATAGVLTMTVRETTRTLTLNAEGRFRARVPSSRTGGLDVVVALRPAAGFVAVRRRLSTVITTPILKVGSRGAAVEFLEKKLRKLRYAILDVNRVYSAITRDAVYAFQKVEGLARDGILGPQTWRALAHARTPTAARRSGSHIEVDKERQVLFEVRKGAVTRIAHVSTGLTGNTPVGRWRIYRKTPGYNSLRMYYSMYFLRGFAIHGYASVPPYPASHGCVRTPLWYAPRIYSRWPIGSTVWVFPTTATTSVRWVSPTRVNKMTTRLATGGCSRARPSMKRVEPQG
jgi:Putative peptidoglycan binding domain/L,D-transpeptidase catalytic domain